MDFYDYTTKKEAYFGDWHVSLNGDMSYQEGRYFIHHETLNDNDWILHYLSKDRDLNEFIHAYFQALRNADIKELNIKIFY
jgi:hypothetical protein